MYEETIVGNHDENYETQAAWVGYALMACYIGSFAFFYLCDAQDFLKYFAWLDGEHIQFSGKIQAQMIAHSDFVRKYMFFLPPGQNFDFWILSKQALVSLFAHTNLYVLAIDIFYLWVFGDNIEYAMGRMRFILFYIIMGFVSLWLAFLFNGGTISVPLSGITGGIAAILGAYARLFPRTRFNIYRDSWLVPFARVRMAKIGVKTYIVGWFFLSAILHWTTTGLQDFRAFVVYQTIALILGYGFAKFFRDPNVRLASEIKKRDSVEQRQLKKDFSYYSKDAVDPTFESPEI